MERHEAVRRLEDLQGRDLVPLAPNFGSWELKIVPLKRTPDAESTRHGERAETDEGTK